MVVLAVGGARLVGGWLMVALAIGGADESSGKWVTWDRAGVN